MSKNAVIRVIGSLVIGLGFNGFIGSASYACDSLYIASQGESVTDIAETQLGSAQARFQILTANPGQLGPNPENLVGGTILNIPCETKAADRSWQALVSPEALAVRIEQQSDLQILDIRETGPNTDRLIPNTIHLPYPRLRRSAPDQAAPDGPLLSKTLGLNGVHLDKPIVLVTQRTTAQQTGQAAFAYWLLKSAGARDIAILDGGFHAWASKELPTSDRTRSVVPYIASVSLSRDWWADQIDIYAISSQQHKGALLDARPDTRGAAEPSAEANPSSILLAKDITFETAVKDATQALGDKGADFSDLIVSFGTTGEMAALHWFYLSELAQMENVRLFPEDINTLKSVQRVLDSL